MYLKKCIWKRDLDSEQIRLLFTACTSLSETTPLDEWNTRLVRFKKWKHTFNYIQKLLNGEHFVELRSSLQYLLEPRGGISMCWPRACAIAACSYALSSCNDETTVLGADKFVCMSKLWVAWIRQCESISINLQRKHSTDDLAEKNQKMQHVTIRLIMADAFDNLLRDSLHQMSYEVTKNQNIAHLPTRQVKDLRNFPNFSKSRPRVLRQCRYRCCAGVPLICASPRFLSESQVGLPNVYNCAIQLHITCAIWKASFRMTKRH